MIGVVKDNCAGCILDISGATVYIGNHCGFLEVGLEGCLGAVAGSGCRNSSDELSDVCRKNVAVLGEGEFQRLCAIGSHGELGLTGVVGGVCLNGDGDLAAFGAFLGVVLNPSICFLRCDGPLGGEVLHGKIELSGGVACGDGLGLLCHFKDGHGAFLDGDHIGLAGRCLRSVALVVHALTVNHHLVAYVDVLVGLVVVLLVTDVEGTIDLEHLGLGLAVVGHVEGCVTVLGAELLVDLGDETFDIDVVGLLTVGESGQVSIDS